MLLELAVMGEGWGLGVSTGTRTWAGGGGRMVTLGRLVSTCTLWTCSANFCQLHGGPSQLMCPCSCPIPTSRVGTTGAAGLARGHPVSLPHAPG